MKKFLSFFIGFLNGLFGAGAGALLVPFLKSKFQLEQKQAHGTSILIIVTLSIITTITFFSRANVVFMEIIIISLGGVVGGVIAGKLLYKIQSKTLATIFAYILIFVGGKMLFW